MPSEASTENLVIKAPNNSSTVYHYCNGFFSIILLAVIGADYKFICVDLGDNGSTSDVAVFNQSDLKVALETSTLGLPPLKALLGDDTPIPYFLIGEDAFLL